MIACAASYCPECGDELGTTKFENRDRDYCSSCDRIWWRQSVPTTSVTVRDEDRVLLIQRAGGRDAGRWDLPAGHPEHDERAPDAAARELREETGLAVEIEDLELVGTVLCEGPRATYRSINYRIDRTDTVGEIRAGSDATEARLVSIDSIRAGDVDVRKLGRLRLQDTGILE